jgi:hypothetical protein
MIIWAIIGLIDSLFISGSKEIFSQINILYGLFIILFGLAILLPWLFLLRTSFQKSL